MEPNPKNIAGILNRYYDLSNPSICKMEGYESKNYKIESGNDCFVLKIYNLNEPNKALLNGENKVLECLKSLKPYTFPLPIKTTNGQPWVEDQGHIYRLLSFLEGKFLAEVDCAKDLGYKLGLFLAQMDLVTLPIYDTAIISKQTNWDLQWLHKNEIYTNRIQNTQDRSLVNYFLMQFKEQVIPVQDLLRKGVIHNDGNDWNILTQNNTISGIIDFGDMCHSWLINELAVALTYFIMEKENPLDYAKEVIKAYNSILPLEELELDVLYYLIAGRLCTSVCNSAFAKQQNPDSSYITVSEKPAWDLLYKWLTINPVKAKYAFRSAAGFEPGNKKVLNQQLELRRKFISSSLSLSYEEPIYMKQSAFQYMYDQAGNTFLDAYNNIMLVGHCHPKVVKAGQISMAKLNTNTRYLYDELFTYSEQLLSKFPPSLNKVFYVNSGSAASDLALRLAQTHTSKSKVMVMEHGYHGNTRMGINVSHYKYNHKGGPGKKEYVIQTPIPKIFESGHNSEEEASKYFIEKTLSDISLNQNEIGTFIAEPIIGCGGQVPLPKNYLKNIYPAIRKQGGVCISDEVQVGFGRLGDFFWGYEMYGVIPDIVILGKPMGNGHPIGAVITTKEIAQSFENGPEFFSSFGGNPVSCAIGKAVLEVIEEEELSKKAKETGNYLKNQLKELGRRYPEISDVRGEGLFLGVEILDHKKRPDRKKAQYLKNGLRQRHILIGTDGPHDNVLKIKPPLYFNKENSDTLISNLEILLREK